MALLPLCFPDFVLAFHCWNLTQNLTGWDSEKCRFQTQSLWKTESREQGKGGEQGAGEEQYRINKRQSSIQIWWNGDVVEKMQVQMLGYLSPNLGCVPLDNSHLSSLRLRFYIYKGLIFKLYYIMIKVSFNLEYQQFWECGFSEFSLLK